MKILIFILIALLIFLIAIWIGFEFALNYIGSAYRPGINHLKSTIKEDELYLNDEEMCLLVELTMKEIKTKTSLLEYLEENEISKKVRKERILECMPINE